MKPLFLTISILFLVVFAMGLTVRNDRNPTGEIDQEGYLLTVKRMKNESEYGNNYTLSTFASSIAIDNARNILVVTGNKRVCIAMTVWLSGKGDLFVYRNTSYSTAATTAIIPINNNRASASVNQTTFLLSTSSAAASKGILVYSFNDISTNKKQLFDGLVLDKNKKYFMQLTNGVGVQDLETTISFYEF